MRRWHHTPDGRVRTSDDGGASWRDPKPTNHLASVADVVLRRWRDEAQPHCDRYGVPLAWCLSMIVIESGGDPRAINWGDWPRPGLGLLQITTHALYAHVGPPAPADGPRQLSAAQRQLLDAPALNLSIGVRLIGALRRAFGHDFPRVSSAFNAGYRIVAGAAQCHPSTANLWGLRCTGSHIDAEVQVLNHLIGRGASGLSQVQIDAAEAQATLDLWARIEAAQAEATEMALDDFFAAQRRRHVTGEDDPPDTDPAPQS